MQEDKRKEVVIYTDGACRGNPGSGGYGAVLCAKKSDGSDYRRELSGGFSMTTNNRMELLAAICGLEALNKPCIVTLYSDSKYLVDAFKKGWTESWTKSGWIKSDKKPVKNVDLWKRLLNAKSRHDVTFEWVKGHAGHDENERCDLLATTAADSDNLPVDEGFEN